MQDSIKLQRIEDLLSLKFRGSRHRADSLFHIDFLIEVKEKGKEKIRFCCVIRY
jgi:hypothetical protein